MTECTDLPGWFIAAIAIDVAMCVFWAWDVYRHNRTIMGLQGELDMSAAALRLEARAKREAEDARDIALARVEQWESGRLRYQPKVEG